MDVSEFIFEYFSLSNSKSIFSKNMKYPTFIYIHKGQGIINLLKSFVSMTSDDSTKQF